MGDGNSACPGIEMDVRPGGLPPADRGTGVESLRAPPPADRDNVDADRVLPSVGGATGATTD